MLAIEIHLLAGRYGATVYNDRGAAEWPPHPARLFSALVSTWADADEPSAEERADLEWLECLDPPRIVCSTRDELVERKPVTAFVPGNDPSALGSYGRQAETRAAAAERFSAEPTEANRRAVEKAAIAYRQAVDKAAAVDDKASDSALEVLPELRNRQARQYPVVVPDEPNITFVWPTVELDPGRRSRLDGLLGRVARIGHSSTHVSCRVVESEPGPATYAPKPDGGLVLRAPGPGLLSRLEFEFARHQGSQPRRLPASFVEYGTIRDKVSRSLSVMAGDWIVLPVLSPAIGLTRSLELTRAVQDSLVRAYPVAREYLTGAFSDGVRRPHVAVIPLADVGARWSSGTVRGVALVFPSDCSSDERLLITEALAAWQQSGAEVELHGGVSVEIDVEGVSAVGSKTPGSLQTDLPYALRPWVWRRSALRWASVTPVALDRHVPDPYDSLRTAEILATACGHAGLPEPIDIVVTPNSSVPLVPRASGQDHRRAFPPYTARDSGRTRRSVHATLTFAEEITGPVLLGAGRYLGRGLFLPLREDSSGS